MGKEEMYCGNCGTKLPISEWEEYLSHKNKLIPGSFCEGCRQGHLETTMRKKMEEIKNKGNLIKKDNSELKAVAKKGEIKLRKK